MRGKLIIFILFLVGLIACTTSVSEIGSDFFDKSVFDIAYIDSVTVKVSTIMGDSIATSNSSRLLVGYHFDEKLGSVTAQTIFQPGINTPIALDRATTSFQSLRIYLKRDTYSYYDTTGTQTIYAFQLTKRPTLWQGLLYNQSKYSIDKTSPLGSVTFSPRPRKGDSLEIALPDAMGQQLMDMAWSNDYRLRTNEDFLKFLNGFAILPDTTTSGAMMGFRMDAKVQPELRLYYRDESTIPGTDRYIRFIVGTNIYYNNIHGWREGTDLSPLKKPHDAISSEQTDNQGYFQSGVGLEMRVDMPYLRTLLFTDRNFVCTKALLEMRPVNTSYRTDALPPVLTGYAVNEQNQLISLSGTPGRLIPDLDLGLNTRYVFDITNFVNSQIQNDITNKNALLILLDDTNFRSTVNRLYLGDPKNRFYMKLKLYYITIPNQSN